VDTDTIAFVIVMVVLVISVAFSGGKGRNADDLFRSLTVSVILALIIIGLIWKGLSSLWE
jgi:hypothetical protein